MFELSIIMPCLNEESTIAACIREAKQYLANSSIPGEILIIDNNSTDSSVSIASGMGARVITEQTIGYGAALRRGLSEAAGKYIIMADSDTTYDLANLDPIYQPLASGEADVVIGIRQYGKKSTTISHRIGAAALSALGRWRFHTDVTDFHCGIRGITKEALSRCEFHCNGMEFATEMIAEASKKDLRIKQVPVNLRKCIDEKRRPKLRTIRDGLRHLKYIICGIY